MTQKSWTCVVVVGVAAAVIWLYWSRETTEWSGEVPHRFRGTWKLVENYYGANPRIRTIHFSANVIVLDRLRDEGGRDEEAWSQQFPIIKVSITAREGSEAGNMVIFDGPPDDRTIAEQRLQIYFGPKQMITVQEIAPTGTGEDHWFDVGEFVQVK